jgi:hypothetical protein
VDKRNSARLPGVGGRRDFWLRMLIPFVFLVLLVVLLVAFVPRDAFVPAIAIAGLGLLVSGAVGLFTGIRGPSWLIYGLIFAELAVLLVSPPPWQGLALLSVPVSALGFGMGKELAFLRYNSSDEVSETTWVVAGEAIADVKEAKSRALAALGGWDSAQNGRFVVSLGHRRFEAWGSAADGFVVHIASDFRALATMSVLTRLPRQEGEVSIPLDTHGLLAWVPVGVIVPAAVVAESLDGFFEFQGAISLDGWEWEAGELAQELRFS